MAIFVGKRPWRDRIFALGMALLVLRSWRNAPRAAIALAPALAAVLERWLPPRPAGKPWIPYAIIVALRSHDRIYNDHAYGGWIGYHGFKVFWDGRNDCYPAEIVEQGMDVAFTRVGFESVLDRWAVDTVVTSRANLAKALSARGWHVRARAGQASILDRIRQVK